MEPARHSLPRRHLIVPSLVFAALILSSCTSPSGVQSLPTCDWQLNAQTWEDINANGIHEGDEPPLENVAVSYYEGPDHAFTRFPMARGSDEDGQMVLLKYVPDPKYTTLCPNQVHVKAIAPDGYVATTPDQIIVLNTATTSVSFGFHHQPDSRPVKRMTANAECREDSFPNSDILSAVEILPNSDTWVTSLPWGDLILRRGGKDYPQVVDGFGSHAAEIALAPDGTLWVAGGPDTGVAHFDGASWKTYTTANSALPSNNVNGIKVTPDGHVWAASSEGIADFNPAAGQWRADGDFGFGSLLSAPDNALWLVDYRTLTRFESQSPRETVRRIPVKLDPVSVVFIWNAAVAADGSVWLVGVADEWPMVVHFEPLIERWTTYTYLTTHGSMPLDFLRSIGVLSDGSLVLGASKHGIIRLIPNDSPENAEWVTYPTMGQFARKAAASSPSWLAMDVVSVEPADDVWLSYGISGEVLTCKFGR